MPIGPYPRTLAKYKRILSLWESGATVAEIALDLSTTGGTVQVYMSRMRREGWPITYRHNWDDITLEAQRSVWEQRGKPKQPKPKLGRPLGISGYRGVTPSGSGKWRAYGYISNQQVHLGVYETPLEAANIASKWREKS